MSPGEPDELHEIMLGAIRWALLLATVALAAVCFAAGRCSAADLRAPASLDADRIEHVWITTDAGFPLAEELRLYAVHPAGTVELLAYADADPPAGPRRQPAWDAAAGRWTLALRDPAGRLVLIRAAEYVRRSQVGFGRTSDGDAAARRW